MDHHEAHHEACAIERQFFARQMNKLSDLNGLSLDQLKQDLKEARQENNKICQQLSERDYENYTLKLEKADLFQKFEEKSSLASNLKN